MKKTQETLTWRVSLGQAARTFTVQFMIHQG